MTLTLQQVLDAVSLHSRWRGMRRRCYDSRTRGYDHYGGRGIQVCAAWEDFNTFAEWSVNNGYDSELSLDRRDGGGDYTPSNCRWTTSTVQNRNKASVTLTLTQVAEIRWLCGQGKSFSSIGQLYSVNGGSCKQIHDGASYQEVTAKPPKDFKEVVNSLKDRRESPRPPQSITIDGREFPTISEGARHTQIPRTRLSVALHKGYHTCRGVNNQKHKVSFK